MQQQQLVPEYSGLTFQCVHAQMAANAVAVADRQAQAQESGLDASGRPVVHKVCGAAQTSLRDNLRCCKPESEGCLGGFSRSTMQCVLSQCLLLANVLPEIM